MKRLIPLVVIVVVGLAGFFFFYSQNQKTRTLPEDQTSSNIIEVSIDKRPYVTLTPQKDGHELKLAIDNLIETKSVDYELIYMAGEFSRGVIGSVDLKGESSFTRDLLLGSCSKNVCKYDEGVTGGTLNLKIQGQTGVQKYEVPWNLSNGSKTKEDLALGDGSFSFSGAFSKNNFYLATATVGVPKMPEGKIVGGPYGIFTPGAKNISGVVKIRLSEASPSVKVYGWDSTASSWKQYIKGFETDGQVVSVEIDRLTTFVAVTP